MVQRIQSVLLLLASGASFAPFALPFAIGQAPESASGVFADGVYNLHDNLILLLSFSLAGVLGLVAIFFFRNRKWQKTLALLTALLILLGIAFMVTFYFRAADGIQASIAAGSIIPVAGLLAAFLARRFIQKDENLVKSMDRLR